ncbi:MAG: hypothetical protein KC417_03375, partial [Myxococcales bacterium]|nr:hypothetical protein [Myxococcales bacterium]
MALRVLLDTDAGSDAERKTSRLHRLLHVLEHKLRDLPAAFQVAVTLVERNAADGVARDALARIARARGAEVEQGEVLERVAAKVEDPALRRELLVTLAELWDNHVQDSGRAESAYRALLPLLEGDGAGRLRVARAIARLITSRPERVRHDGQTLRAMVELEVELENERPKRRAALLRLAKLRESVDDDVRAAMNALDEARALGDSDPALRRELIRLAEKAGDPARLAAELAELEMEAETPAERRDALLRRVTVLESTGASPGVLRDALEAHLRREKPSVDVADRLLAVAAQGDDWDARVDALTARIGVEPDAVRAGEFAFQRAEIERKELRRYLDAVRSYRAVLDAVPDHPGVLEALLAIAESASTDAAQAAAVLAVPGLERGKRYPELVRALDVAGRAGEGRVDALLRSAEVLVTELRDPPGALERIALAMDAAPDDALRKLLDVADAYARELPSGAIAPLARRVAERAPDPESRRLARMRAAESYLASGGNDEAEDLLEQMLEDEPGNLAALDLLLRMYESTGANEKLFDALRRKAELVTSPQERIELLVRAADLAEGALSDPDAAIELYEELRSKGDPKLATARLERLYERSERWGDAAELLEEELERGRVDAAEANYRLGELARVRFEDMDRALRHFRAAFQRRRDHAPTAAALEEMLSDPAVRAEAAELLEPYFMQRLAWDKVTRVLDVRIAAAASNDERRKLALRRARIAEEYLEDLDGAFDAYASMLGDDPTDSAVRDALERLGRVLSRERGVADVYFRVVDQAISDTPATVDMARVAASRYRAAEAEPERVARLLERVIAFDPTDNEAVEWLDAAYAALGAIDRRLELARERADRAGSDAAAADVLHARAELLWKAERPVEEVLEAYVEILDLVPADERALDALDGLLRAEGRWDDLVEHLERRLDLVIGTPAEVEILFSIAKVLHAELARSQDAIGVLRSVVERNPRHAATIQLLEELVTGEDFRSEVVEILAPVYRGTNQWKKLVAVLESDLVVLDDLDARAVRLAEIAELHERRGRNPALALDAWARLFAEHPDRDEVREQVERLGIATGQWDALVRAYEHAAERSTDATVIGELLAAIARVHDQERGDPRLAIDAYERLWTHDPSNLFVLDELDSLQTLLSDWESVDDVIGRKIETETEPEPRGELLRRRGVLRRDQLGDAARAVEAFEAAVAEEPDDLESWRALDGLFESAEQFERRDLALERRYELEDPPARFEIGVLRAALLVDRLGRPDDAVDVLRRVVEDEPRFMPARAALATLFEREGRHAELANALEDTARVVEDAHEAAGYLHRAAETTEQHLELPSLAIERYTAALDLAPEFAPSLDALVRMSHRAETRAEASHLALPRLEALGRWDDAVEILEELVTDAEDVISRHALLLRIARTEETVRDDAERAFAALERAFEARPDDAFTADELARVGELLDVWPRVVAAFEKAAKALEPAVPSGILYQRAAEFAERRLGDPARAVQALVAADAIEHDPPHVLAELDRLYLALGDARALDGVLVRRLELAAEDAERVGFYVRLGAIRRDALEDVDGSIAAYREALETEPSNASARGALEAMLGDGERIGVVSAALEAAYISLGDEAARAELESRRAEHADNRMEAAHHWELAAGHWRTVGDANRAFEAHRAAFVCAPEPPERLEHLDAAVAASGAWERLAGAAEEAVAQADVPDADRVRVLVHAAGWYAGSLGSMDAALECLGRALAVDASASTAHAAKSDLLHMTRRYEEELDALDAWLMHVREEAERLRLLRRAAKVAAGLVHDATRASAANEAILAIEADDVEAMDALAEQYVSLGRMRDLEGLLLRRAEVTDDPVLRASLHSRRGSVLESVLDQPEEAVGAYERVLDDAPSDPVAFDALERLYPTLGQYEAWANLLGRRIDGLEGVARIAPLIERAKIRRTLLHDLVGARADVDAAFDIEPHSSMAFDELEAIHLSEEAWEAVVALLERRADAAQSRGDRGGEILFLERAAETARDHGFNASAEAAYVRLLDLAPDHQAAVRGLVWLAEKKGDDVALRDALERLVRMESDAPRAEAAMRLAELEDRCGTPEDARRAVQVAFETSPTNEDIASNLRKRLTEANDFRGIVHMLVLRAEHDPENATAYLL